MISGLDFHQLVDFLHGRRDVYLAVLIVTFHDADDRQVNLGLDFSDILLCIGTYSVRSALLGSQSPSGPVIKDE